MMVLRIKKGFLLFQNRVVFEYKLLIKQQFSSLLSIKSQKKTSDLLKISLVNIYRCPHNFSIEISKLFFQTQRGPTKFAVILVSFINSVVTCVNSCHNNF